MERPFASGVTEDEVTTPVVRPVFVAAVTTADDALTESIRTFAVVASTPPQIMEVSVGGVAEPLADSERDAVPAAFVPVLTVLAAIDILAVAEALPGAVAPPIASRSRDAVAEAGDPPPPVAGRAIMMPEALVDDPG